MKIKHLIIGGTIILAVYVSFLLKRQFDLLKKAQIKIVNFRIHGLLTKNASLELIIKITNNSDIDLMANNGKFDVFLNQTKISTIPVPITKKLDARSFIEVPLNIRFNPALVIQQGMQALISDPKNVVVSVKGKINVVSSGIAFNNIKIDETMLLSEIIK